jgi:hypothetical protein
MSRPKLTERVTIRLPEELLADCAAAAERRNCSVNEVVLSAVEYQFSVQKAIRGGYYETLRNLRDRVLASTD